MLQGMYGAWAARTKRPLQTMNTSHGDRGGIRSTTVEISGPQAYGRLKTEAGVHRLVRMSPLDPAGRRHTSFAQVEVIPAPSQERDESAIPQSELRFDAFHSSAPGGQNVQKTATAVRLTHIPTGITATCQTERSQHQNRRYAMRLLTARIQEHKDRERELAMRTSLGQPEPPSWGNKDRSYILQPSQHIIDHRTGYRAGNAHTVIQQGQIDALIEAALLCHNPD